MTEDGTRLVCHGCGAVVLPDAPSSFRCPAARDGDDIDHVLEVDVDLTGTDFPPDAPDSSPMTRFRDLLYVVRAARVRGASDAEVRETIGRLDDAVAGVDGHGFVETPYGPAAGLQAFQEAPGLWIKHEAAGVSGSHKARHLIGVALHLELASVPRSRRLAIASCGNAALAAAVVARAVERPLDVFVPDDADVAVLRRLGELGATVTRLARPAGRGAGDPCLHAFHAAVAGGALPFSVQGPENGLVIDAARTIAWEIISVHARAGSPPPEHVVVQVGGGALLAALASGFETARALGAIARTPVFHGVQTEGGAPFVEACRALQEEVDGEIGAAAERRIAAAARTRSKYMRPWPVTPRSVARGILDDETYDWFVGARAIVRTGGSAITVADDAIERATARAVDLSPIAICPTGAAGLAGALALAERGTFDASDRVAVLFTGARR